MSFNDGTKYRQARDVHRIVFGLRSAVHGYRQQAAGGRGSGTRGGDRRQATGASGQKADGAAGGRGGRGGRGGGLKAEEIRAEGRQQASGEPGGRDACHSEAQGRRTQHTAYPRFSSLIHTSSFFLRPSERVDV